MALILLIGSNLTSALEPSTATISNTKIPGRASSQALSMLATAGTPLRNDNPSETATPVGFARQSSQTGFTPGTSNGFFYVGAFVDSNSDPSAVPNSGVQTTVQVVSQQVNGCLSFWVNDDAASNIWGQVGYYICNGSTPVAFYQVWNLTTNQVLTTGTTSVSNGYHKFSMYSQNRTSIWIYSLDGSTFGYYNMGANVSSSTYGISADTEEGYVNSPYQPTQQVEFSPALQVMQSGTWYTVQLAYEPYGCGINGSSCWGIEGNLQDPTLPTDTIIVGGDKASVSNGAWLWNDGKPDFTLTASPTSIGTNLGVAANSTINVSALNGFSSSVTLAVSTNSTALSCGLSPTSIPSGSGTSTLSCTSSIPGRYLANVTGTSGTLTRATGIVYQVTTLPGFTLAGNPTTVNTQRSVAGNSTITVTPQNGFTGPVDLTVKINSSSLTWTLTPAAIMGGRGASMLSCTAPFAGNYLATILGTNNGATAKTTTVTFRVQNLTPSANFAISANPDSVGGNIGTLQTSTITISPIGTFTGQVTLTDNVSPNIGLSCELNPTVIPGGSGTSKLSCTTSTDGTFTITVNGNSGSLTRSVTLNFKSSASISSIVQSNFYAFIIGAASLMLASLVAIRRTRKRSPLSVNE